MSSHQDNMLSRGLEKNGTLRLYDRGNMLMKGKKGGGRGDHYKN